jgi:hypothetical protein
MARTKDSKRFKFGENWARFLTSLNEESILPAEESLRNALLVRDLKGLSFLYIGSGRGLFSLPAPPLWARVTSFDFYEKYVTCTKALKYFYYPTHKGWSLKQGAAF